MRRSITAIPPLWRPPSTKPRTTSPGCPIIPGQLRPELLRQRAAGTRRKYLLDIAYVGNHGTKLQGFLNGNQLNPAVRTSTGAFTRPFSNWPDDITLALNEFTLTRRIAGSLRAAVCGRAGTVELLHLVALARQRQRPLEGNSPSPRMPTTSPPTTGSPITICPSLTSPVWSMTCL
jgi:hypothetical protein